MRHFVTLGGFCIAGGLAYKAVELNSPGLGIFAFFMLLAAANQ